jgi:hypothetical protein
MAGNCAARLARNLDHPPSWLDGFAGYLAVRLSPGRAVTLLHQLAGILATSSSNTPAAVLAAAGQPRPGRPSAHPGAGGLLHQCQACLAGRHRRPGRRGPPRPARR